MFTGLVKGVGEIVALRVSTDGGTLTVRCKGAEDWGGIGASVAVDGVCLTLCHRGSDRLTFDVLAETFQRTNLKLKQAGCLVNLEPSLRLGDPVGGHWVTGHVDGVGEVCHIRRVGRDREITVQCDPVLSAQMVTKGSVCCDGISLTLVDVQADTFSVHIIPHTWEHTAWRQLAEGWAVNIETDLLGKYVAKWLTLQREGWNKTRGGVSWERLRDAGFGV